MTTSSAVQKVKEKVENGAAKVTPIQNMIEQSVKELGRALPSHMNAERLVRIALTTLRLNPKLYQCEPRSFLGALFQCAQLGLEPNIEGQAYIIPYNTRGVLVAQFQVGYKGYVELFFRHQNAVSLSMEKVCRNDQFTYNLGSGEVSHVLPDFDKDRGEVIAYYAAATMKNGGRAVKVMSKKEVEAFAKRFSKCWDRQANNFMAGTPWKEHFDAMAMKTVLKQLMKLVPRSIEIQKAIAMDETVKTLDPKKAVLEGVVDMVAIPDEADHSQEALPEPTASRDPGQDG
jgi:recombination protein RecT